MKTAIMVDGGFYRRRSQLVWGDKSPELRAIELSDYCHRHLNSHGEHNNLYRIFYYDCPPSDKVVFHPFSRKQVKLKETELYQWTLEFFECLKRQRKFALRLGKLADEQAFYTVRPEIVKKLCGQKITWDELSEEDFVLQISQKGVDMRIGIDIASVAFKHQVDQIILLSGDSDFVPAAKLARREGIDFILDPLGAAIKPDLFEHIDVLRSCDKIFSKQKR